MDTQPYEHHNPPYDQIVEAARRAEADWESCERVEWSDAEELIRLCREIPENDLPELPQIQAMLTYAAEEADWDSEYVALWPDQILADLALADHECIKRFVPSEDRWEVYRIMADGSQQWLADTDTEAVADRLISVLGNARPVLAYRSPEPVTAASLYQAIVEASEEEPGNWRSGAVERLVSACQATPAGVRSLLPDVDLFISAALHHMDYPESDDEFDLRAWGTRLFGAIEGVEPQFTYVESDHWQVQQVFLSGEEAWVATVETEAVAHWLASSYPNPLAATRDITELDQDNSPTP